MAIDILNLSETDLLPTLGNGDWLIALPDNHPDMIIPAVLREQLANEAARQFVRWAIGGISVEINHHSDPPWDHSGHAYRHQTDPLVLMTRYKTLQEWLDEAYTGNSRASFVSGMGLFWDTYGDDSHNVKWGNEMKITRVQYTVKPDFVEQNKKNIEAVMSELRALSNTDLKYASYVLDDGKTFMHLVHDKSNDGGHLPTSLESFKHFQSQLQGHFEVPPKAETLELVDSSFNVF